MVAGVTFCKLNEPANIFFSFCPRWVNNTKLAMAVFENKSPYPEKVVATPERSVSDWFACNLLDGKMRQIRLLDIDGEAQLSDYGRLWYSVARTYLTCEHAKDSEKKCTENDCPTSYTLTPLECGRLFCLDADCSGDFQTETKPNV